MIAQKQKKISGCHYVAPEIVQLALNLECLLTRSNTETIDEDDTEYGWDNN